jgi:hypothetical protein
MEFVMKKALKILAWLSLTVSLHASANLDVANELVKRYATIAKMEDASYSGPSAAEGKTFFERQVIQFRGGFKKTAEPIACASCHTSNPADVGKHIVTGKKLNHFRLSSIRSVLMTLKKLRNNLTSIATKWLVVIVPRLKKPATSRF